MSTTTQIKLHVKLVGGHKLSEKNMDRIVARATFETDIYGNALVRGKSPIDRLRDNPPYIQRWKIKKQPEGFIFCEVGSGSGTCGHHKTVRALVANTLMRCPGIVVEVLP